MDAKTDSPLTHAAADVSLVRGGAFYRIQHALGLIRPNHWNLGLRITLLIAIGWLPQFLITALTNPVGLLSLLKDYRVHSRLLIAIPVLLVSELFMDSRFRPVVKHIRQAGLLQATDMAYMDKVIAAAPIF
jgi:hypothetical protein